jgi:hypothetical protein
MALGIEMLVWRAGEACANAFRLPGKLIIFLRKGNFLECIIGRPTQRIMLGIQYIDRYTVIDIWSYKVAEAPYDSNQGNAELGCPGG